MGPRQCILPVLLFLILLAPPVSLTAGHHRAVELKNPRTWTIMVYMADDYEPDLPWQDNINQMEAAIQVPGMMNIIALVDPLGLYDPRIYQIEHDDGTHGNAIISARVNDSGAVIPLNGSFNMGSPETLRAFIEFTYEKYGGDNLVLIMWGHAGGWRHGLCPDESDILTLPEFAQALNESTTYIHHKIDVIGIDSCGEASLEMLTEIHPYADYFVASEKNIPSDGLPYERIIDRLSSRISQTPVEFASGIADDFIDWSRYNSSISASMGVFDLSRVRALDNQLGNFSRVGAMYDNLFHDKLRLALDSAENYTEPFNVDFGDLLGRFVEEPLPPDLHNAAVETMLSYSASMSHLAKFDLPAPQDGDHVIRATGAVIYPALGDLTDGSYTSLNLSDNAWYLFGRLLRSDHATNQSRLTPMLEYHDDNGDGKPDTAIISWPFQCDANLVSAFRQSDSGLTYVGQWMRNGTVGTITEAGDLTISAAAVSGGVVQSQKTLHIVLYGQAQLHIALMKDGAPLKHGTDVGIVLKNSTLNEVAKGGVLNVSIAIPTQASFGDLIDIQVVDHQSGAVVGEALFLMDANSTSVTVEVHNPPEGPTPLYAVFLLALLPGMLILLYDLQLHLADNKKRRKAR